MSTVSSEIYKETNFQSVKIEDDKFVSKFKFFYPENEDKQAQPTNFQKLGDLVEQSDLIELVHFDATSLQLVGQQVWRGALLLADYLFSRRHHIKDQNIMELSAGVGLTSIAGAIYARKVICTDVDLGCILQLIRSNVARNSRLLVGEVSVLEFDFLQKRENYSKDLLEAIDGSDLILAADVIYDKQLTNAFISVIDAIFERQKVSNRLKTVYLALEKRYVFTSSDCEQFAPMYDYFLKKSINKPWRLVNLPLDFPQYFQYERNSDLVLLELSNGQQQ